MDGQDFLGQHNATGRVPSTVGIGGAGCSRIFDGELPAGRVRHAFNGAIPLHPRSWARDNVSSTSVSANLVVLVPALC